MDLQTASATQSQKSEILEMEQMYLLPVHSYQQEHLSQ